MRISLVSYVLLFTTALLLLFPSQGLASTKYILDPLLTVGARYDSNFFGMPDNERGVYTYLIQPGIQLGLEAPKTSIYFNYTLEAYYYDDSDHVPSNEIEVDDFDYSGHLLALSARHNATDRLTFGLDDGFYRTRYPVYYDRLSTTMDKDEYDINRLTGLVFYDFGRRFTSGLRYRRTDIDWSGSDNEDWTEDRYILTLNYDPTRTITLDLDYHHYTLDYDRVTSSNYSDYTSDEIFVNFQKRYRYLAFDIGAGYHARDFDASNIEDETSFTYKIGISGQSPPPPNRRRYLGKVFIRPLDHFYLGAERNYNSWAEPFIADRYVASFGSVFREKIHARLKGWYQTSDYEDYWQYMPGAPPSLHREDDTYDVSAELGYLFSEKLSLNFTAGKKERDSNIDERDYVNHYYVLTLDFNYDIRSRAGYTEEALFYNW